MQKDINEIKSERYPIGKIDDDIVINFMHYQNFNEAKSKWESRKTRIDYNNLFVIMTDRDGFNDEVLDLFDKIPYKKILFTSQRINRPYTVYMPEFKKEKCVGTMTDFYRFSRKRYYELHFDFAKWFSGKAEVKDCLINYKKGDMRNE